MKYVLDTNVLKQLGRPQPNKNVAKWLATVNDTDLFITAFTVTEVQTGISEKARNKDPKKAADAVTLQQGLDSLLQTLAGRILPLDAAAGKEWGRRRAKHGTKGEMDLAIISIMATQPGGLIPPLGLVIPPGAVAVTQNLSDFRHRGINVLDPFDDPPTLYQDPET